MNVNSSMETQRKHLVLCVQIETCYIWLPARTMATRKCSKPRWGSNSCGALRVRKIKKCGDGGYIISISTSTKSLIDDWEVGIVAHQIASARSDGKINHYWVVKNILGLLMEDVQIQRRNSKTVSLEIRGGIDLTYLKNKL